MQQFCGDKVFKLEQRLRLQVNIREQQGTGFDFLKRRPVPIAHGHDACYTEALELRCWLALPPCLAPVLVGHVGTETELVGRGVALNGFYVLFVRFSALRPSCICEIKSDEFVSTLRSELQVVWHASSPVQASHFQNPPQPKGFDDSWQAELKRLAVNHAAPPIRSPNKAVGGCRDVKEIISVIRK